VSRYAAQTSVSPEKSRNEIEAVLRKYGADGFEYRTQARRARIGFVCQGRAVRFDLTLPDPEGFNVSTGGRGRSEAAAVKAHQQEVRRLWRALLLGIKAKLEMVTSGVTVFEEEFLAHLVVRGDRTVGDVIRPQLAAEGAAPLMLAERSEVAR
jgi:hypothetical protein